MGFDLQPVLHGDRVVLRPLRPEDWDALYAVASDPAIWAQHPARDRHEEAVFRAFFAEALACGGAFAVLDRATGEVIGSTRYFGLDEARSEIEVGWTFLARSHWGGAANGEMKRLLLAHAFGSVARVVFVVGRDNRRSRRALEKIGARCEGSAGRDPDTRVLYAISRAEFALRDASAADLTFVEEPLVLHRDDPSAKVGCRPTAVRGVPLPTVPTARYVRVRDPRGDHCYVLDHARTDPSGRPEVTVLDSEDEAKELVLAKLREAARGAGPAGSR